MTEVSPSLSVVTLSVNGLKLSVLNLPIKRLILEEWIFKNDLNICCLQEIHFRSKNINKLKVKG